MTTNLPATLEGMLTALASAGYEATLAPAAGGQFCAAVTRVAPDDAPAYSHDATGGSMAAALAAAMPATVRDYLAAMSLAAPALAAGLRVTYAPDEACGGWFADLRDELGRVVESGGGHTQEAARAHLLERIGRRDAEGVPACQASHPLDGMKCEREAGHARHAYAPFAAGAYAAPVTWTDADQAALAAAPAAPLHTLGGHIAALAAQGYEVTFTAARGDRGGYFAHLDKADDPDAGNTGDGRTVAEALWTVSPLHGDDEPFPGELPAPGLADDVRTLSADMTDVYDRLNALEDRHDKFDRVESALVHMMVDLLCDTHPDGETACHLAARRAEERAAKAATQAQQVTAEQAPEAPPATA
jgi:hypothetical protein